MPFAQMVAQMNQPNIDNIRVSKTDYEQWQYEIVLFDKIRGLRYGQSFCNHFGITDATLYYYTADQLAREWIENNYVED